jgi:hypothetical protein
VTMLESDSAAAQPVHPPPDERALADPPYDEGLADVKARPMAKPMLGVAAAGERDGAPGPAALAPAEPPVDPSPCPHLPASPVSVPRHASVRSACALWAWHCRCPRTAGLLVASCRHARARETKRRG